VVLGAGLVDLHPTEEGVIPERRYDWADPAPIAAAARESDGLSLMHRLIAGELPPPPIAATLGFRLESVAEGRAVFVGDPAAWQYNPIGSVHGGVVATLLDSATGCAVHTRLPRGTAYTSLDLAVKYLRRVTADSGPLTCTGEVLSMGRRTALAEARLTDSTGRLLAHGTSSCLLFAVEEGA
jgi:uncharacterized protein (TIGR00369 family)